MQEGAQPMTMNGWVVVGAQKRQQLVTIRVTPIGALITLMPLNAATLEVSHRRAEVLGRDE